MLNEAKFLVHAAWLLIGYMAYVQYIGQRFFDDFINQLKYQSAMEVVQTDAGLVQDQYSRTFDHRARE